MGGALRRFLGDLKRRHIYRVAAVYTVVAWIIIQLVGNLTPMLRLPEWAGSLVLVLLLVAFPITLIFAWIHELAASERATAPTPTTKLDWALAGGVVLVIGGLFYQSMAKSPDAAPAFTAARQIGGTSIAVLPLANLSGAADQEFLSDGMTDEIISALARVDSLRVVGRSSAFQFKGQNKDLRAVGQALGATYLIDGSLRRAGNRVRITAQLVRAEDGIELWTDNYDRELTDVFAIEEDIAQAIAGALRAPLGLAQGERLVSSRTADVESYQDYLRGRGFVRGRNIADAIATLESAVAHDPEFAPAWAMLAQAYRTSLDYSAVARRTDVPLEEARAFVHSTLDKGERAARRAIELDPHHDGGYASLATILAMRGQWIETEELFAKALAIDPNNPEALYRYGQMLNVVGRLGESLRVYEQMRALEPLVPIYRYQTAAQMYFNGRNQAAIALLEATSDESPARFYRNLYLARAYAASGRFADSADALLGLRGQPQASPEQIEVSAELIRAPRPSESPGALVALGDLAFVYAYVGAQDRLLEGAERSLAIGAMGTQVTFWSPTWTPARKTERFKAFVRDAGLVGYWRQRGWPDLCSPQGDTDFACD
jgi:TolB-like protein/Tfp pilus assembly protein PilF